MRVVVVILAFLVVALGMAARARNAVVADSTTCMPLVGATVFDRRGVAVGVTDGSGRLPYVRPADYPVAVRYLGYNDGVIPTATADTLFLSENVLSLPEVVIESRQHKVMHMLAYVREYSTLTTYTDTVFLFREKMVDFMLNPDKSSRFRGWTTPRVIKTKSYYRFTDSHGLDSVSDKCSHHFSWSDWLGIVPPPAMPPRLRGVEAGVDTVRGRYGPAEVWMRDADRIKVEVNVLADTVGRKWVPNLSTFFRGYLDFERFRLRVGYDNVAGDSISPMDLTGYSYNIESNGRGHDMFRFNRVDESFFVGTYAEVYIIDKEYITVKEARKWERLQFDSDAVEIYGPPEASALQPSILALIDRVNSLDHDKARLAITPDRRLAGRHVARHDNLGHRALSLLKIATGISAIRSKRNRDRQWRDFRRDQMHDNNARAKE